MPIENIFYQIKTGVEYSENENFPFTNNKVLIIAYVIMAEARVCKDVRKEWSVLSTVEKACPNFKICFF